MGRTILVVRPVLTSRGYQILEFFLAIRLTPDDAHFQLATFALLQLPNEPLAFFPDPFRVIIDNAVYHIGIGKYSKDVPLLPWLNLRIRLAFVAVGQ